MTEALFEGFGLPPAPMEDLSADRRRTERQRRAVELGRHPLTGGKTYPEMGTCGDCRHRIVGQWHNRTYAKCFEDHAPKPTHGAATDVRAWWPACVHHDLGDPKVSADAARWTP